LPCRRYHAQVARGSATAATDHCKHALFGADACGSPCQQLCSMGPAICPQSFDANCMTDCANKVPAAVDPTYKNVTNRDVVCRLYHLAVASESAQLNTDHCPHASIASTADTCATAGAATLSVSALFIAVLALITKFSS
jgi:glutamate synthase domain-containing protein 2